MFNTSTKIYNESFYNLKINAVGGTLVKSHPRSFFITASPNNNKLFNNNGESRLLTKVGRNSPYDDEYVNVVIIQTMLTGENHVMCEVVKLKEYLGEE